MRFLVGKKNRPAIVLPASGLYLIEDVVLTATGSFDITGIPAIYKHLRIYASIRENSGGAAASSALMRFNGDTGSNYDDQVTQVNNTSVTGAIHTAQAQMENLLSVGSGGTANQYGANVIDLLDYTSGHHKVCTSHATCLSSTAAGDMFNRVGSGQWRSTAVIDRIQIYKTAIDFTIGSRVTVYGIA